ncbi:MAG: SH3 domain-containing protein [Vampirovibrionia bacterium]
MKIRDLIISFCFVMLILAANIVQVNAENVCYVKDPTGTKLNVRSAPGGKIINTLNNGFPVDIIDVKYDKNGKGWANIGGILSGKAGEIGWVYRDYLNCSDETSDIGEKACTVADPTGSPLNVRSEPNGKVLSTLKNGENVFVEDTKHINNKPWYKIGKYINGYYKSFGWVYGPYLDCK